MTFSCVLNIEFVPKTISRKPPKMSVKSKLMSEIAEPMTSSGNKVTIVGIGQVGMACAFSILTQVSFGYAINGFLNASG